MNPKTIIAIVLIALGFAVLVYPGLNFTTPGETVNFFGIVIETRERHFIPPVVGALLLVGGIVLLLVKPKSV
jgi:hypothetical protein